ncbi:unnamed protein product [Effrenium voratum]|nr:unnamed protein product [Effrenium voratum]
MEKELHVTVVTLSGTHLAEHQGDGLVRDLKSLVAAAGGPPALLQRLMWEDRILKDEDTLESLGQGAVTVQMILESRLDVRRNLEALALPGKGKISADQLEALCEVCRDIFMSEPMLLEVPAPATVVGTLCGGLALMD